MFFKIYRFILCFSLLLSINLLHNAGHSCVFAQDAEDPIEGEYETDSTVEADEGEPTPQEKTQNDQTNEEGDSEKTEDVGLKPSVDADTTFLFTSPTSPQLPAGKPVKFLVGFTNKGDKDFMVDSMEASFRYPQDYSFHVQNFTGLKIGRLVSPEQQVTFAYGFTPSDTFNARPFGLTVNLNYKDLDGTLFQDAVYNDTVNIVEPDDGLDGEMFFMYIFLAAVVVLLFVGVHQLFQSFSKKKSRPKPVVEMGTQNNKGGVDYDWLPKETLSFNSSPKKSPRSKQTTSPRERRSKRKTGSGEDK